MPEQFLRRVAVIGGGANGEHEVSLASAGAVARAIAALGYQPVRLTIDTAGRWHGDEGPLTAAEAVALITGTDCAFPMLHGVNGEDGAVAGLLSMTGVPFVGSPVRAGALAMDKGITKLVAASLGIRTARSQTITGPAGAVSGTSRIDLSPPLVVKPTSGGSSNGVSVVLHTAALEPAIAFARADGGSVLVEEFVVGREVDLALFRARDGVLHAGAPLEIAVSPGDVFSRERKYAGAAPFIVPARLTEAAAMELEHASRALYDALGCSGVARFDFFLTASGAVLNEVNTSPGFTEHSQVPRMYAEVGLSYINLVAALLDAVLPTNAVAR